ncbi:MAG TPA: HEAT repeat domain-containing protein [Vicinamibacterales bacterium]|nr:HEAT repeat domain-containing protein [Vicinamibacterales bacterium]
MITATRTVILIVAVAVSAGACASRAKPPAPEPPQGDKLAWILRLEDQRVLRDPVRTDAAGPAGAPVAPRADLVQLLGDADPIVRRRAALAIGRTGVRAGVPPLIRALEDTSSEVRQMAAFALGLLGDKRAEAPLTALLTDPDHRLRGAAAEALGLMGAAGSANAIGDMVAGYVEAGLLASIAPDDLTYPMSPEIEACRLGLYALARLKAYEPLARAVLNASGEPVSEWWPIAYALRRVEDPKAAPALRRLLSTPGVYTKAFAARGLGAVKAADAVRDLLPIAADVARQPAAGVEAIRALGAIGDRAAAPVLRQVLGIPNLDVGIRAEAVTALAATGEPDVDGEFLLDLVADPSPVVRASARRALAAIDDQRLLLALSGADEDPHWSVRAATADALAQIPPELAIPLLMDRLNDSDLRVVPSVLRALVRVKAPDAASIALERLEADDVIVRATAAELLGELCPPGIGDALRRTYDFSLRDAAYDARAAILSAAQSCDQETAKALAKTALADKDWAVRLRAVSVLEKLEPGFDAASTIRPAPTIWTESDYTAPGVVRPPYSTQAYFETDHGTIQVQLAMLEAPLTVHNFVRLARKGYFDGLTLHRVVPNFVVQDGDPRGDGNGGPGYAIRDELSRHPYGRGTVGMALAGPDTGGSQYFITHGPQPHLDGRYTVFGQVVAGMEVVDRLRQGDIIRRVWVWDGVQ